MSLPSPTLAALREGMVIPALPLALNANRKLDERRQRALFRYYAAAGAGGIAVGVHTTQFAIRDPKIGMLEPLLALANEEMNRADARAMVPLFRVAGVCGVAKQALSEAEAARENGFHAGLLSLAALKNESVKSLLAHCKQVSQALPIIGFYLQPSVGGRVLPYEFWRGFADIQNVLAVKIAPFNRYQTLDVVRAFAEAGREDVALYTGNDDAIVLDLLTPYRFMANGAEVERRIVGGLLGHWSVGTKRAVELLGQCRALAQSGADIPAEMLRRSVEITDCNAAFFDSANGFAGCIAGIHEVLRGQGLLEGVWLLDPEEGLSAGQSEEIERVLRAYPHLHDSEFIREHLAEWMA